MLVLSRHRDETIMIGDDTELTIIDIRGDKVRIGIKAPSHVPVHRKEIYDAIRLDNEQAMSLADPEIKGSRPVRKGGGVNPAAQIAKTVVPRSETA